MAGSVLHLSAATKQPLTDPPTALREAWGAPNPQISSDRKVSGNVLPSPIYQNTNIRPYAVPPQSHFDHQTPPRMPQQRQHQEDPHQAPHYPRQPQSYHSGDVSTPNVNTLLPYEVPYPAHSYSTIQLGQTTIPSAGQLGMRLV